MINWLNCGNDYGEDLEPLLESEQAKGKFIHEYRNYSQNFAYFIQSSLGCRYGSTRLQPVAINSLKLLQYVLR
jgi:hypothetical protein